MSPFSIVSRGYLEKLSVQQTKERGRKRGWSCTRIKYKELDFFYVQSKIIEFICIRLIYSPEEKFFLNSAPDETDLLANASLNRNTRLCGVEVRRSYAMCRAKASRSFPVDWFPRRENAYYSITRNIHFFLALICCIPPHIKPQLWWFLQIIESHLACLNL